MLKVVTSCPFSAVRLQQKSTLLGHRKDGLWSEVGAAWWGLLSQLQKL